MVDYAELCRQWCRSIQMLPNQIQMNNQINPQYIFTMPSNIIPGEICMDRILVSRIITMKKPRQYAHNTSLNNRSCPFKIRLKMIPMISPVMLEHRICPDKINNSFGNKSETNNLWLNPNRSKVIKIQSMGRIIIGIVSRLQTRDPRFRQTSR